MVNFVPTMVELNEKIDLIKISDDEDALRAEIAAVDEKIAIYKAEIKQSDAEIVEYTADAAKLAGGYDCSFRLNILLIYLVEVANNFKIHWIFPSID